MRWRKHLVFLSVSIILPLMLVSCGGEADRTAEIMSKIAEEEAIAAEGKIAYVDGRDIWVVDVDGGDKLNITDSTQTEYDPCFSPDGRKIAFTRDNGGRSVWVANCDGTEQTELTNPAQGDGFAPAWSPNGTTIAFLSQRDYAEEEELSWLYAEAYLMNTDGGEQRRVSFGEWGLESPGAIWWLPQGDKIAVWEEGTGGGTAISLVDIATGEVSHPEDLYSILKQSGYMRFEEKSDWLRRAGDFNVINHYVINPAQTNLIACELYDLALVPGYETKPGFYIIDLDGGTKTKVSEAPIRISCEWSLDGACLYFTDQTEEEYYGFFMVGKDGADVQQLDWLQQIPYEWEIYTNYADFHIEGPVLNAEQ